MGIWSVGHEDVFAALLQYVVSALVAVAFGGMSHDLWHNSLQKPIGNQYDRPEENEGFDLKPPLSAGGNKFSIL
jgi:hypothetical protein